MIDQNAWQRKYHSLPVGHGGGVADETAWQRNKAVSLTACRSWVVT
jgi:hypothetical protein